MSVVQIQLPTLENYTDTSDPNFWIEQEEIVFSTTRKKAKQIPDFVEKNRVFISLILKTIRMYVRGLECKGGATFDLDLDVLKLMDGDQYFQLWSHHRANFIQRHSDWNPDLYDDENDFDATKCENCSPDIVEHQRHLEKQCRAELAKRFQSSFIIGEPDKAIDREDAKVFLTKVYKFFTRPSLYNSSIIHDFLGIDEVKRNQVFQLRWK